jgi:hypothetical protein
MSNWLGELVDKHRGRGVLIDTNILLLLFTGALDRNLIPKFKRLDGSTVEDYDALLGLLSVLGPARTTPQVLTEVSNFWWQQLKIRKDEGAQYAAHFAGFVKVLPEHAAPSSEVVESPAFLSFGMTDGQITRVAVDHLILTEDFRLTNYIQTLGLDAINFNHLRTYGWD